MKSFQLNRDAGNLWSFRFCIDFSQRQAGDSQFDSTLCPSSGRGCTCRLEVVSHAWCFPTQFVRLQIRFAARPAAVNVYPPRSKFPPEKSQRARGEWMARKSICGMNERTRHSSPEARQVEGAENAGKDGRNWRWWRYERAPRRFLGNPSGRSQPWSRCWGCARWMNDVTGVEHRASGGAAGSWFKSASIWVGSHAHSAFSQLFSCLVKQIFYFLVKRRITNN